MPRQPGDVDRLAVTLIRAFNKDAIPPNTTDQELLWQWGESGRLLAGELLDVIQAEVSRQLEEGTLP